MKKKGLIIATIVMVLVLAVSLTTATYAWFTNTGSADVADISFAVASASDLVIGLKKNNTYGATPAWSDFVYDSTTYAATAMQPGTWSGTDGLGLSVDTTLDLSQLTKAVYSFSGVSESGDIYTEDSPKSLTAGHYIYVTDTWHLLTAAEVGAGGTYENYAGKTYTHSTGLTGTQTTYTKGSGQAVTVGLARTESSTARICKAAGSGNVISAGSMAYAVKNTDYLDVVFGVSASSSDVIAFGCYVYIKNAQTISSIGMNAAIHAIYSTDGTNYTEVDLYGAKASGDANSSVDAPSQPTVTVGAKSCKLISDTDWTARGAAAGDVALYIPIFNSGSGSTYADTGAAGIKQIHLIIYICGPDSDCITAATGTGATISIDFLDVNKATFDAAA